MRFMLRHPIQYFVTLRAFPMTKWGQRRRIAKTCREFERAEAMRNDAGAGGRFR